MTALTNCQNGHCAAGVIAYVCICTLQYTVPYEARYNHVNTCIIYICTSMYTKLCTVCPVQRSALFSEQICFGNSRQWKILCRGIPTARYRHPAQSLYCDLVTFLSRTQVTFCDLFSENYLKILICLQI